MAKPTPAASGSDVGYEPGPDNPPGGKGKATPTRKEKEAARKRPLVTDDRGAARKQARAAMQAQRDRARIGLANGEEKFLPVRDRGPQKRYVRDYVDARFSVGEILIPLMVGVIILTFFPQPEVQFFGVIALWVFFIAAIVDVLILGLIIKRKVAARFGESRAERVRWYAGMRALQLRAMRLPKPQVKRRQYPD